MNRLKTCFLWIGICLPWQIGCGNSTPKVSQKVDAAIAVDSPTTIDLLPQKDSPMERAAEQNSEVSTAIEPEPTAKENLSPRDDSPEEPASENPVPQIDPSPFRLLLPTKQGPLLVDLEILIDQVPLTTAFDQRIRKVLTDADADGNQSTSWDEFLDHLESDPQQFGRGVASNRSQRRGMIKMQDRNRNQIVDDDEAVNVLFRDAGFDAPFRLQGTDYYRGRQSESKLFAEMDHDGNGSLNNREIAAASKSLLSLDQNADQRIDLTEVLSPVDNDDDPAWNRRRSRRDGNVATDLFGYVDWSLMSYSLDELRQQRPFGLTENPIDQVDGDQNDSIDSREVKEVLQVPPDLIVTAAFDRKPGGQPKLSVRWARSGLRPWIDDQPFESLIALSDKQMTLCISLTDRRDSSNQIPPAAFAMLDANNDGELDSNEIPDPLADQYSLEEFDADQNGSLTLREINDALANQSAIWNVQLRGRGAEFPDAMFAYLDSDHDWMLSTREVLSASSRLDSLTDANDDLNVDQIPTAFMVQIVRGDPQQRGELFQFRTPRMNGPDSSNDFASMPRWANRMDANLDGDISRLEFVGSAKHFDRLDTNDDGFIDTTEVHSADKAR